ncbi:uncharacterized protein LOC130189902 [Pseudoliparis swirei]|uniref:uncharacterized protein LOC130189902 n=1 Tax=Pseudoliparis swirei TaxID=2059687 RepID=UPI0024BD8222|nr:uncharacterized protein LOC130189902 [Pseudoliparis swirei]
MAWRVKQAVYYLCVGPMCSEWKMVLTNTGTEDWGYIPPVENAKNMIERFHLFKMIANPSVHRHATTCNPGGLTIIDPKLTDSGTYSIGMKESGRDRIGNILIQVSPRAQAPVNISKEKGATESPSKSSDVITYVDLTNFTANDQLEIETGFNGDQNLWLQQLRYTARTQNLSSCLACAAARPRLTTAPFPINPVNDIVGFECMMRLFSPQPGVIINCKTLSILFPAVSPTKPPMGVLSYPENTAPDGSITRALAGLTSLSNELAENSGIDTDPLTSWLDSVFGKYKAMFLSAAISLAVFTALLSCCGCCCIPCLRSLSIRLIETAIEKKDALHGQQMSLLGPCSVPDWACIEPYEGLTEDVKGEGLINDTFEKK